MKLRFPYFNDSDIGYIDDDFLDNEEIVFIDSEEEEKEKKENEAKQLQAIS